MMNPTPSSSLAPPPLSPYGTFSGDLFQYGSNRVAFESLSPSNEHGVEQESSLLCRNKCVLIGGFSDGLLAVPYAQGLQQVCQETGWSLVQPIFSSSYTGFGHGSLDQDADEMMELVHYLLVHRQAERICFIGHSTGCQDICHFLQTKYDHPLWQQAPFSHAIVAGAVLQAPVSDREQPAALEPQTYQSNLQMAKDMCQAGKGEECMPRAAFWAPITAQRFVDLQSVGGLDDYFSSDYTDKQLADRLEAAGKWPALHMLVAFSGSDEYVAPNLDTQGHTQRLADAANTLRSNVATALHLPAANHNLSQGELDLFLDHVKELLVKSRGEE